MKIMVVDDSESMRTLERLFLRNLGVSSVVEARDGVEALSLLKENMPIDIIILDWEMPRMDGIRCLERIKQTPQFKDIKVIMCTGKMGKEEVVKAIKKGADGYIIKPLKMSYLKFSTFLFFVAKHKRACQK